MPAKPRPTVTVKTRRGDLIVHPDGRIEGLWDLMRAELRTGGEVRRMAGNITRLTFLRWRSKGFPAPVLTFPAKGGPLDLWSRTEAQAWIKAWRGRRAGGQT